jgi:hypothetical protein
MCRNFAIDGMWRGQTLRKLREMIGGEVRRIGTDAYTKLIASWPESIVTRPMSSSGGIPRLSSG